MTVSKRDVTPVALVGPWRRPDYKADDIYPPFGCWDKMRAGGVNISGSRLLVHDVLWSLVAGGWDRAVNEFTPPCSPDEYRRFLHDLLDARGEFGRLLLVLAAAERMERDRDEADGDEHFATAHPRSNLCDCGRIPVSWWEDAEMRQPVIDQLRRCLAALEDDEADALVAYRSVALRYMADDTILDGRAVGRPITWCLNGAEITPAELDALRDLWRELGMPDELEDILAEETPDGR